MPSSTSSLRENDVPEAEEIVRHYLESRDFLLSASRHIERPDLKEFLEEAAMRRGLLAEIIATANGVTHSDTSATKNPELDTNRWWLRVSHHFGETSSDDVLRRCLECERNLARLLQDLLDSGRLSDPFAALIGETLTTVRQSIDTLEKPRPQASTVSNHQPHTTYENAVFRS